MIIDTRHASIQTTLDRYGHLMPEFHQGEARKLDQLVFGEGRVGEMDTWAEQNGSKMVANTTKELAR